MATIEEMVAARDYTGIDIPILKAHMDSGRLSDPPTQDELDEILNWHRIRPGELSSPASQRYRYLDKPRSR